MNFLQYAKKSVDTTIALWDILYKVKVPMQYLISETYIREFGIPSSGNKEIDAAQNSQYTVTYLNIDRMVELYREGAPIYVLESEAPKKIYEAISEHLHAWKDTIENGINVNAAPYEDLILLDNFAHAIYENAKYTLTSSEPESPFTKMLMGYTLFSIRDKPRQTMLPSQIQNNRYREVDTFATQAKNENNLPQVEERQSMADLFKSKIEG